MFGVWRSAGAASRSSLRNPPMPLILRLLNAKRRKQNVLEEGVTALYLFFAFGLKRQLLGPIETLGSLWCSIQRDERSRTRSALVLA
jgi:hypothetical protein